MASVNKLHPSVQDEALVSNALLNAARRLEMTNIELADFHGGCVVVSPSRNANNTHARTEPHGYG